MKSKTVLFIILGIFFSILAFDLYLYSDGVPGNSITQTTIEYSKKSSLIPWFIGLVMGFLGAHFFDDYKEPRPPTYRDLTPDELEWLKDFASVNVTMNQQLKATQHLYGQVNKQGYNSLGASNAPLKSVVTGLGTSDRIERELKLVTSKSLDYERAHNNKLTSALQGDFTSSETKDPEKKDE